MPLSGLEPHDILDTIREPMVVLDSNFRVLYANRSFYDLFRVSRQDTVGRKLQDLGNGQWNFEELRILLEEVLPKNRVIENFAVEHVFPEIGRRTVLLNARSVLSKMGNAKAILLAIEDVTERANAKILEEQLAQAQKLEALGRLAGGVAHDFNNLLTVIKGYVELSLAKLRPESPVRDHLLEVEGAADRATALTRGLLAFGRKHVLSPRILEINFALQSIEKLLRRLVPENIRLELRLAPAVGKIKGDPAQIDQVLLNLVLNARDAMPHGGTILIETQAVELEEAAALKIETRAGSYALLQVTDTGLGMSSEIVSHLFEPFFTTKEVGQGTGLGLATVYGIVKQAGGHIEVQSKPGEGSRFKVFFPTVEAEIDLGPKELPTPGTTRGHETVLLAEDEEHVRGYLRLLLQERGYQVLEARNGSEAMDIVRKHAGRIRLLITDVVMPEMSGPVAAGLAAQVDPLLKVLYLSGHSDQAMTHEGMLRSGADWLEKPFASDLFLRTVRSILDRRPPISS